MHIFNFNNAISFKFGRNHIKRELWLEFGKSNICLSEQ